MSGGAASATGAPAQIAEALIRWDGPMCVISHHNPDGDAIGSTLGLGRLLRALGRDVKLLNPDEGVPPDDLAFLMGPGEAIEHEVPADLGDRMLVAVDCASEGRMWKGARHRDAKRLLNIDHHSDNVAYGDVNLVDPSASSVGEILVRVAEAAGWPLSPEVATPLYVAMVTDCGRFGYGNTSPETHRVASVLLEAGVDPAEINRHLYEDQPLPRLILTGRALARASRLAGDRLVGAWIDADDFRESGTDDSEGIVEILRSAEGASAAVLAREAGPPGNWRVSLRSARPDLDVAEIAHEAGGGGHPAAAGFSTRMPPGELFPWVEERVLGALDGAG